MTPVISETARRRVSAIAPQATIRDLSSLMARDGAGVVVVVEDGRLLGVVSDRDVVTRVVAEGRDPTRTFVSNVMTSPVRTVSNDITPDELVGLAHERRFKQVPVIDINGAVTSMLSIRDLLCFYADELDLKHTDLLAYVYADGPGG